MLIYSTKRASCWSALDGCEPFYSERDTTSTQAEESVREALQREVYGLEQDRDRLLSAALAIDPENATARWHAGYVRSNNGGWLKVGTQVGSERRSLLAKYQARRLARRDLPDDQVALADWCAQHGLIEQERAHLLRVCQLEPDHAVARRRLGFERVGSEWLSREDLARKVENKEALEKWTATLASLLENMASDKPKFRRLALEQIKQIRDSAAIPAVWSLMGNRDEEIEVLAVEITSQITDPAAAIALAQQAILSSHPRVRKLASAKLTNYDPEAYVPTLVASLYMPVTTQYNAVRQGKQINYHHQLIRESLTRREMLVFDTAYRSVSANGNQRLAKACVSVRQRGGNRK